MRACRPRICKTGVTRQRITNFVFGTLLCIVPSARETIGFLRVLQPARVIATTSTHNIAASWRMPAASNGWLFIAAWTTAANACFSSSEVLKEVVKIMCNGPLKSNDRLRKRKGALHISTVYQTRTLIQTIYRRLTRHHMWHGTCTRLQLTA